MLRSTGAGNRYLAAILILGIILRLVNIGAPFSGNHAYKEIEYAGAAELFLKEGRFLEPRNYFTGPEQTTFPILPYIMFLFYKFFWVSELVSRLPLLFFAIGTLVVFYELALLLTSRRSTLIATFFMAIIPISVYFSRNIQPESPQLFFSLLAIYYYLLWQKDSSQKHLVLITLTLSFAILSKYTAAYLLAFFAVNLYHDKKPLKKFAVLSLSLIPPALWFLYSLRFPVGAIGLGYLASFSTLTNPAFYLKLGFFLFALFTPVLPLFSLGYFLKNKPNFFLSSWFIITLLHIFALANGFYPWNEYYLYPLVAPMSLLAAEFLASLKLKKQHLAAALLFVLLTSLPVTYLYYYQYYPYKEAGDWLRQNTPENSVIIIAENPAIVFYAKRTSRIVNNLDDLTKCETVYNSTGAAKLLKTPLLNDLRNCETVYTPTYLVVGEFFEKTADKSFLREVSSSYHTEYNFRGGHIITIRDGKPVVVAEEITVLQKNKRSQSN